MKTPSILNGTLLTLPLLALLALPQTACKGDQAGDSGAPPAQPGELLAGVATAPVPAPLGIGTAGFGPFDAPASVTPFASIYPGTTQLHGRPEIKVVALSRGEGFEVIFVRLDSVGVFQQLRRAVVLELQERTGRDYDDALIFGATHTHSGPGRVIDGGGLFDIIADSFFPEFYDLFVQAMADTIQAALADLQPARLGTGITSCEDAHQDRRCEDGLDYTNDALPLIAVERSGQVDAVVMSYAIHGTVLDISDLTLSQDVSGAIEQAVEDRFDHPVEVMMLNAWAADVSPADPEISEPLEGAEEWPGDYARMERVGWAMAEAVHEAMPQLSWEDEPELGARTRRVPIDREVIGYADGEFPYDYGGVYCEAESDCDPETTIDDLDERCLPFNEEYPAPNQTVISAGRVGPFTLLTFPGEPGTLLAEDIMAQAQAAWPEQVGDIFFVGYGQDYLGYSIQEWDWWQGGYEASGALWGPRQGEYLAGRVVDVVGAWLGERELPDEPEPITAFDEPSYTPYQAEEAVDGGVIVSDLPATAGPGDMLSITVNGGDPWLGPPQATVELADGSPVTRPNGAPLTVADQEWQLALVPSPAYDETDPPAARTFAWTLRMPVQRSTPGWLALADGDYRIRLQVPLSPDETVELLSGTVSVSRD